LTFAATLPAAGADTRLFLELVGGIIVRKRKLSAKSQQQQHKMSLGLSISILKP
jgi:hypothetical protein